MLQLLADGVTLTDETLTGGYIGCESVFSHSIHKRQLACNAHTHTHASCFFTFCDMESCCTNVVHALSAVDCLRCMPGGCRYDGGDIATLWSGEVYTVIGWNRYLDSVAATDAMAQYIVSACDIPMGELCLPAITESHEDTDP